jgi:catechol 2,3-dioxygenase-like lactoylglutathione lyase family enzyme
VKLDHVGINVGDLPAMTQWYVAALGLEVEFEFALEQFEFSGVMLRSADGHRIELLHRTGNTAGIQVQRPLDAPLTRGLGHLALTVDDLADTHRDLLAAGAAERMPPSQSPEPGVRMAFVADPEGNLIELVERS